MVAAGGAAWCSSSGAGVRAGGCGARGVDAVGGFGDAAFAGGAGPGEGAVGVEGGVPDVELLEAVVAPACGRQALRCGRTRGPGFDMVEVGVLGPSGAAPHAAGPVPGG